jgi:hypothetical protein
MSFNNFDRTFKVAAIGIGVYFGLVLAVLVALVFVAAHFIGKVW